MDKARLILEDREKRYNRVLELVNKYKLPIICGKLNYPGEDKNTREADRAFDILNKELVKKFDKRIKYEQYLLGYDGKSILLVVNIPPIEVKKVCVELEEKSPLGRIFDLDVYEGKGTPISREEVQGEPRKCILCGEIARGCVRAGKHTLEETLDRVNKIIKYYGDQYE